MGAPVLLPARRRTVTPRALRGSRRTGFQPRPWHTTRTNVTYATTAWRGGTLAQSCSATHGREPEASLLGLVSRRFGTALRRGTLARARRLTRGLVCRHIGAPTISGDEAHNFAPSPSVQTHAFNLSSGNIFTSQRNTQPDTCLLCMTLRIS